MARKTNSELKESLFNCECIIDNSEKEIKYLKNELAKNKNYVEALKEDKEKLSEIVSSHKVDEYDFKTLKEKIKNLEAINARLRSMLVVKDKDECNEFKKLFDLLIEKLLEKERELLELRASI